MSPSARQVTPKLKNSQQGTKTNLKMPPVAQQQLANSLVCLLLLGSFTRQLQASPATTSPREPTSSDSNNRTTHSPSRLQLRLASDGSPRIPGLYDDFEGLITPIQGQAHFNELVLGLKSMETNGTTHESDLRSFNHSLECVTKRENLMEVGKHQTVSLVQFYMATCPDCQGFSPYFKRLAYDIGPHWRKLVKIFTVNCNDFHNIHLCQEQNPKLIVPMVRWYVLPIIQADAIQQQQQQRARNNDLLSTCQPFRYPRELLNVAHRQFIEKQRRDLISLRRATLRFLALVLDELSNDSKRVALRHHLSDQYHQSSGPSRLLFESLPMHWHNLAQLGRDQPEDLSPLEQFHRDLKRRITLCANNSRGATHPNATLKNFIIFENRRSFLGRTLVADWSQFVCSANSAGQNNQTLMLVHRTSDLSLLASLNLTRNLTKPLGENSVLLASFELPLNGNATTKLDLRHMDNLELLANIDLVAESKGQSNETSALARPKRSAQIPRLERIQQRASLERFYSQMGGGPKQPTRYAAAMAAATRLSLSRHLHRRDTSSVSGATVTTKTTTSTTPVPSLRSASVTNKNSNQTEAERLKQQAESENVNWTPEIVYPGEERVRYELNWIIAQKIDFESLRQGETKANSTRVPGSLLRGSNPDEIKNPKREGDKRVVDPLTDDLTLMYLTDYYKGLDEIVHIDLLTKGDLDGYQLLASCCFLRELKRYFPFQGDAHGSEQIGSKSRARHYIQLVQEAWLAQLKRFLLASNQFNGTAEIQSENNGRHRQLLDKLTKDDKLHQFVLDKLQSSSNNYKEISAHDACPRVDDQTAAKLEQIRVPIRQLEQIQQNIEKQYEVGLPSEKQLKWNYCGGSGAYLRGHTCSLWILFHTLTVNEYLLNLERVGNTSATNSNGTVTPIEYKFQIDYSQPPIRHCDPKNPDEAYLAARTSELHVNETQFALANIINFVRFYLPCTNCAAHFSCMVEHSPGLSFGNLSKVGATNADDDSRSQNAKQKVGVSGPSLDSHLLWLWEGHNRVNERTRGTHSEDPLRPKHIFPVYEACPKCYLQQPANGSSFNELRFNRPELVKFIVARYRKSAILNNKINIESLYRKTG